MNKLDINIFITDTWRKYVGDKWRLELRFWPTKKRSQPSQCDFFAWKSRLNRPLTSALVFALVFICPSLRQDVLWYTNVRLSLRLFHMSRSNLRTPRAIHFKFHSYWNWWSYGLYTLWWNFKFSFQSYGKESLYKYCMNVDDRRIMRSWRSCLFHLLARKLNSEKKIIYSIKFFHNFLLSESSFTCSRQVG